MRLSFKIFLLYIKVNANPIPNVILIRHATTPLRSAARRDLMVVNVEEMLAVSVVFASRLMHLVSVVNVVHQATVAQMVRYVSIEMGHLFLSAVQRRMMEKLVLIIISVKVGNALLDFVLQRQRNTGSNYSVMALPMPAVTTQSVSML